jgi:hypothetical protein
VNGVTGVDFRTFPACLVAGESGQFFFLTCASRQELRETQDFSGDSAD